VVKSPKGKELAKKHNGILLDGGEFREYFESGFSDSERIEHIMRMATEWQLGPESFGVWSTR